MSTLFLRMNAILVLGLLIRIMPMHGQNSLEAGEVPIPPSPEAAGLGTYLNFPVGTHSGVPSIQVPLYSLENNEIVLPINLSYHSGGIKVDQVASWVGMGWSLQAGGVISREVRDLPDDDYDSRKVFAADAFPTVFRGWFWGNNDYLSVSSNSPAYGTQPQHLSHTEMVMSFPDNLSSYWEHPGSSPGVEDHAASGLFKSKGKSGEVFDLEPDVYFVNGPGFAFRFVFDKDGNPSILGGNDYEIVPSINPNKAYFDGFVIRDPLGFTYEFKEIEENETTTEQQFIYYTPSSGPFQGVETSLPKSTVTAWHLTRIASPSGEEVLLTYDEYLTTQKQPINKTRNLCFQNGTCEDSEVTGVKSVTYKVKTKLLSTIEGALFKAVFVVDPATRQDLQGGRSLDRIEIYKKADNQVLTTFDFETSYRFSSNPLVSSPYEKYRLFLMSVQQLGENNAATKPPYKFTYNSTSLPARNAVEQDHWGYFNGKADALIPQIYTYPNEVGRLRFRINPIPGYTGTEIVLPGSDRSVDPILIQAGVLTEINFPTGGKQMFEYESNEYFDPDAGENFLGGGLRIKSIELHDNIDPANNMKRIYSYHAKDGSTYGNNIPVSSGTLTYQPQYAREMGYGVDNENGELIAYCSGLLVGRVGQFFGQAQNPVGGAWNPKFGIYLFTDGGGSYEVTQDPANWSEALIWDFFTEKSNFSRSPLNDRNGLAVGYEHVEVREVGNGRTSYEFFPPKSYLTHATAVSTGSDYCFGGYAPPGLPQPFNCNPITRTNGQSSWGFIQDQGTNIYPYPPITDVPQDPNFLRNSKLKATYHYSESGNMVSSTQYEYTSVFEDGMGPKKVSGIVQDIVSARKNTSFGCRYSLHIAEVNSNPYNPRVWAKYDHCTNGDAMVSKVITITYPTNGSVAGFETAKTYRYGDRHFAPIEITETNGDGNTRTEKLKYVFDYQFSGESYGVFDVWEPGNNANGVEAEGLMWMQNEHRGGELVEKQIWKTSPVYSSERYVGGSMRTFRRYYAPSSSQESIVGGEKYLMTEVNQPLPNVPLSEIDNNGVFQPGPWLNTETRITSVDREGRVLERENQIGIRESVIYPPGFDQPVAVVQNGQGKDIAYTSFERSSAASEGYWDFQYLSTGNWVSGQNVKTGKMFLSLSSSASKVSHTITQNGTYIISLWYTGAPVITAGSQTATLTNASSWTYAEKEFELTLGEVVTIQQNGTTSQLDELRLFATHAHMTTYCYDKAYRVITITDPNSDSQYFEYDELGRLTYVRDLDGNIIQGIEYHYQN